MRRAHSQNVYRVHVHKATHICGWFLVSLTVRIIVMKLVCVSVVLAMAVVCQAGPSLHQMLEGKEAGSIWALIVAGSNTWMNYRHQVREHASPHAADCALQL